MRLAALYDVHGNLPVLEATLSEIAALDPDLIVVGGDVAGGPLPRATLDWLMALGDRARFIMGNGDREMMSSFNARSTTEQSESPFAAVSAWAAAQITPSQRDFLASFAESVVVDVDGLGPVLFCHGSPRSDEEMITAATPESRLEAMLQGVEQRVIVCGHTHVQFKREIGDRRVINAGSVGMPYEGRPGAYWLRFRRCASTGPHTTWSGQRSTSGTVVCQALTSSHRRTCWSPHRRARPSPSSKMAMARQTVQDAHHGPGQSGAAGR